MIAAQHIQHEKIIEAIAVDVGKVNPHGIPAGLAQSQPSYGPKFSRTLIDPDPVRRIKIVADINVRLAVAVDVPEHHRETPIIWRLGQGFSVFVEECSADERNRHKICSTLIAIENVRF